MKLITFAVMLMLASSAQAQSATVTFDTSANTPVATVQNYTATLYVNGTPFPLTDTCVLVTGVTPNVVRCTAQLPDVSSALTTSGNQNFEVTLKDVILEGAKSSPPFVLARPNVTTNLRIQ